MGSVLLSVQQRIACPPKILYDLLDARTDCGWVFGATFDQLAVGGAVTLRAPLGDPPDSTVDILGRVSRLHPPWLIEVVHYQPWRGRIRLHLDADGVDHTTVRLLAEVDPAGMQWLLRRRGHHIDEDVVAGEHRVGLLTSKSGPGSTFAAASEYLARMATDEINADGGLNGSPLRLLVGDDATDPGVGVLEARRLVRSGCRALLVTTTSSTYTAVAGALEGTGVPLVHTCMNEGGLDGDLSIRLGERPDLQLAAALAPLRQDGLRRWFLVGNDYVWPHRVHRAARDLLGRTGEATIVGEALAPLGTRDFEQLIEAIKGSDADLVLSSFVGADLVAFERQCHAMGVRDRCRSLALTLDEPVRQRIGAAAATGLWGVAGYFQDIDDGDNPRFLRSYHERYGALAPPVGSISESAYDAVYLYADAARRADGPTQVVQLMSQGEMSGPRGPVAVRGRDGVSQRLFFAEAREDGFLLSQAR